MINGVQITFEVKCQACGKTTSTFISVVRDESTTIKRSWVAFKNKYQSLPESRKVVSSESAFTIVIYRMVGFEIITIDDEQKLKVCDDNNEFITSLPYMLTRYEK